MHHYSSSTLGIKEGKKMVFTTRKATEVEGRKLWGAHESQTLLITAHETNLLKRILPKVNVRRFPSRRINLRSIVQPQQSCVLKWQLA
jgi:hypothetical protein